MLCTQLNRRVLHYCFPQDDLRALIRAQAASFSRQLRQVRLTLQQTIDGQGETIAELQQIVDVQNQTIAEKCDVIERQESQLQQVNATLEMLIVEQQATSSAQDALETTVDGLVAQQEGIYKCVYVASIFFA